MLRLFGVFIVVTALVSTQALAQYNGGQHGRDRWPNWYIGVQGAIPFVNETDVEVNSATIGDLDFETGFGVGASLGYTPGHTRTFLDHTRFELEYFYRHNELDELNSAGTSATISDDISSNSYMFNVYYDIDTGTRFSPYIGGGIGFSDIELNVPSLALSDEDMVFAYQLMAGVGWQPESLLNTVLQIGYRYYDTQDPEFGTATGARLEHEYEIHSIEAGARFRF